MSNDQIIEQPTPTELTIQHEHTQSKKKPIQTQSRSSSEWITGPWVSVVCLVWFYVSKGAGDLTFWCFQPVDSDFRCYSMTSAHSHTAMFSRLQRFSTSSCVSELPLHFHFCFLGFRFFELIDPETEYLASSHVVLNPLSAVCPPFCLCLILPPLQLTGVPWFVSSPPLP